MGTNPSTRFFWNDYENDDCLKACTLAAQGLWMRMLCLAAKATPVGFVKLGTRPCSHEDLARLTGEAPDTIATLLHELESRGVFSRDRNSTIYNRRMVRVAKRSETNRENGRQGGSRKHKNNNTNLDFAKRNSSEVGSEHPSPSISSRASVSPIPPPNKQKTYYWSGRVLNLTAETADDWRKAFAHLGEPEFRRELMKADAYYTENPTKNGKYFYPFFHWLDRADKEAAREKSNDINESW